MKVQSYQGGSVGQVEFPAPSTGHPEGAAHEWTLGAAAVTPAATQPVAENEAEQPEQRRDGLDGIGELN